MKNLIKIGGFKNTKNYIIGGLLILLPIIAFASTMFGMTDEERIARSREIQAQSNLGAEILRNEIKELEKEIAGLEADIIVKKAEIEAKDSAIKSFKATWNREQGRIEEIEGVFQ